MFGLGFFEIILILVGILIFVRPQDLPHFVYRIGKVYGQIKGAYNKFYREINLIKNQMDEIVENQKNQVWKREKKEELKDEVKSEPAPVPLSPDLINRFNPEKLKNKKNEKKTTTLSKSVLNFKSKKNTGRKTSQKKTTIAKKSVKKNSKTTTVKKSSSKPKRNKK